MHVGNYPTRNFATFGPLCLQPPFIVFSVRFFQFVLYTYDTGQMSDSIRIFNSNLQSLVFLVNSHSPHLCFSCIAPFSPEVTKLFCLIPSRSFTKPLYIFYAFISVEFSTVFCNKGIQKILNYLLFPGSD